nr:unnamed protein product [Callosobruchus analis]
MHTINKDRILHGEYHALMRQLRQDEKRFYIYFRMISDCFDEILNLIKDEIGKRDTNYREAICPEERLAIALRFLATGDSFSTIGHSYRVGFSTVGVIVKEVCQAITNKMQGMYMPEPTKEIWKKSAKGFYDVWKFPNCIGSIDGKHITIKCPKNTGSTHFCYLKKFSIVLMAIVGPEFTFLCVDIGGYGKNSDGGIFEESNMGRRFAAGLINVPHVLIGDEAFALKPTLMRPYPYRQSRGNKRKEEYNTRLCTARRVVENAFGILAQKWRIFHRPIETSVDTTIKIVRSTCILHNFIRTKNCDSLYFEYLDPVESTMDAFANLERDPRRATNMAFDIREKFADFFNK